MAYFAALVLSLDSNPERIRQVMEKTDKLGIAFNKDAFNLLLAIRQMNAEQLRLAIVSDGVEKMKDLAYSARSILEVMSKDFKFDDRLLKAGLSNYFNEKFKHNVKGILTTPYLLLLGNKMEERRQYLDNILYFEWAGKQAFSEEKKLFSLLVLKNEELKDCNGNLDNFIPRLNKRRELDLGPTVDELEKTINAETIKAWQRIFQFFIDKMKEPAATGESKRMETELINKKSQDVVPELHATEETAPQTIEIEAPEVIVKIEEFVDDSIPVNDIQGNSSEIDYTGIGPIEFPYGDLKISFNFQKGRLTISHMHSDQKITVASNGRIRDDEEFVYHKDGRLELEGKMTDLSINVNDKDIILSQVTEDGVPTGVYLRFPLIGK